MPSLRKSAALQISGGLYPSLGFAPTRLNTADDPTRDAKLRPSCASSCLQALDPHTLQRLHALQLSRPTAGWVRLCLLLGFLPRTEGLSAVGSSPHMIALPDLCGLSSCSVISVLCDLWTFFIFALLDLFSVTVPFACFRPLVLLLVTPKDPENGLAPELLRESRPSSAAVASSPFFHCVSAMPCFILEIKLTR